MAKTSSVSRLHRFFGNSLARLFAWWKGEVQQAPRVRKPAPPRPEAAAVKQPQWPRERVKLVQAVWGSGFTGPGGADHAVDLVKGCGLTKADTLLEVGPSIGGGPLAVTGKFRNYVVGCAADMALADGARKLASSYGLSEKLQFNGQDLEALALKSGFYRAAVVRDALHRVKSKETLLNQVASSLRDNDSQMILVGLVCRGDLSAPVIANWISAELGTIHPWSEDDLKACLASLSLLPRSSDDETDWYRAQVVQAWRDYQNKVTAREVPAEFRRALLVEANIWAHRMAVIDAGALRYLRVTAVRKRS